MTEVRDRRWLAAAPRDVWKLISTLERYPDWCPWIGSGVRAERAAGLGVAFESDDGGRWRIVEYDPPRRLVHRAEHVRLARSFDRIFELRSDGADGTWLELVVRYRPALGRLGQAVDRLAVRPAQTRHLPAALDAIERLVVRRELRRLG